jgi:hypothetical protein
MDYDKGPGKIACLIHTNLIYIPIEMSTISIPPSSPLAKPNWLELVRTQVEGLKYGVVQLVVHDGRVTQIERTEKVRLTAEREDRPSR